MGARLAACALWLAGCAAPVPAPVADAAEARRECAARMYAERGFRGRGPVTWAVFDRCVAQRSAPVPENEKR